MGDRKVGKYKITGEYKIMGEYKIRPYVRIHHNIWMLIFLFCVGFGAYRLPLAAADWAASKLLIVAHHKPYIQHVSSAT